MGLEALSDEELMVMYQNGSEEAFKALYNRHSEKIYGFLRKKVWNMERTDELYQEVFLKMHRSKQLYNKSLPVLPWIFSITKSVLVDGLRVDQKVKRDSEYSEQFFTEELENSEAEVKELISQLPKNQRRVIEMRYIDEKTFEEIASTLDTTSQNARQIVSRTLAKLKSIAAKGD